MQLVIDGIKLMPCSPTFCYSTRCYTADQATTVERLLYDMGCIRFKRFSVNASAGDANKGNDQLGFYKTAAGATFTLGITDYDNEM
jgi:hypothetical protein